MLSADKSKAQAGVEATSEMQKGNANTSEINSKLREETMRLRKKVDELMANLTALMTNKGTPLSRTLFFFNNIIINYNNQ